MSREEASQRGSRRRYGILQVRKDTKQSLECKKCLPSQLRQAQGALVVYDICNRKSFDNVRNWLDELPNLTKTDTLVMLVGTKLDMVDTDPSIR